jgi:hypothetical protein
MEKVRKNARLPADLLGDLVAKTAARCRAEPDDLRSAAPWPNADRLSGDR